MMSSILILQNISLRRDLDIKNYIKRIFKSSLFKASGIYTFTSILNSTIPFFLMPILTRYLTPEDYGITAMFSMLVSIISVFTGLSVHGAINRVYFEKDINFKEYVANCIFILFASSTLTFLTVLIFLSLISKYSGVPANWVIISVIFSFLQFLTSSNLVIYQARMQAKYYSLIQIGQTILNFSLSIFLVVFLKMNWQGRLIANFLAVLFFGLLSLFILSKNYVEWKFNKDYIIHALKFGIPLIPHTLGGILIATTSRFIITNILGLKETGIYTAGLQIGSIVSLFADAFNRAYIPWLFDKLNQNDEIIKLKIVKFTYLYFIMIIAVALILGFSAPFIVKVILGKAFRASSNVVLWIALGGAFTGMYYMVTNYIFYVYKTIYLTWITFTCGIISIPLTIFFTKFNGVIGASQAYFIVLLISFVITWILASRVYKMPWDLKIRRN